MADTGKPDDGTDEGPSLEMPSFSLRRRKKAPPAEDVASEPAPEAAPAPVAEPEPEPTYDAPTAVVPAARKADAHIPSRPDDEHEDVSARAPRELPLSGVSAAAATGVAVGILAVLLAWLATSGCEAVRGTSSCGGGPGLLILLVVLALLASAGSWLLARFGEPEAGSTSLLAIGIMAVLVMVFLLGSLDEPWALVAVPVTAVIGYCGSWWVTHAVVGDDASEREAQTHDVR